ncbi:hypothetical protein PITCH_A980001 [uncultured Desulfobacterium sp.]|uniref:Uncharacterized protein n=1 Tax=uncultured Desulfobacterium sp. TaxID=201089 RepID=A0A445N439_9BACT|nr:hypothetical protein PITCH_A980001 [uncultured Desulfobacterium sp.]
MIFGEWMNSKLYVKFVTDLNITRLAGSLCKLMASGVALVDVAIISDKDIF